MSPTPSDKMLVWDLPTRLFHWLLAAAFLGAYALSESEPLRGIHAMLGYTAGGLVAFRLAWGIVGTRYARFSGFSLAPRAVIDYLRGLLRARPPHYTGHNPAGSWAVLVLLAGVALTATTGWALLAEVGPPSLGDALEDLHEFFANATLAMVAVHVTAVIASSLLHRENLVRAMVDGSKRAQGSDLPAAGRRRLVGAALLALLAAFWLGAIPAPALDRDAAMSALAKLKDRPSAVFAEGEHERTDRARGESRRR
jgi:cytochrome b